jgi:hypothetical protein
MKRRYTSYDDLLTTALAEYDSFTLVWRNMALENTAAELERRLQPWLLEDLGSYDWPGTTSSQKARVRRYRVCPDTIAALRCVDSVFGFVHPHYPEDLAFYASGETRFASVSHEGEAWFT